MTAVVNPKNPVLAKTKKRGQNWEKLQAGGEQEESRRLGHPVHTVQLWEVPT